MIVNDEEFFDIIERDVRYSLKDEEKVKKLIEEKYQSREDIKNLEKKIGRSEAFGMTFMSLFFLTLAILVLSHLPPIA